jgi:hypothetical protein
LLSGIEEASRQSILPRMKEEYAAALDAFGAAPAAAAAAV